MIGTANSLLEFLLHQIIIIIIKMISWPVLQLQFMTNLLFLVATAIFLFLTECIIDASIFLQVA